MREKFLKEISYYCAAISIAISILAVISWHLGFASLLKMETDGTTFPYFSGITLLLSGLSIIILYKSRRVANLFGLIIFILGIWNLLDRENMALKAFFNAIFPEHYFVPISLTGTFGFIIIGATLLLWTEKRKPWKSCTIQCNSLLIVSLGLLGLLSFIFKTRNPFFDGLLINFYAALAFLTIGTGFFATEIYFERRLGKKYYPWLPYISSLVLALFLTLFVTMLAVDVNKENFAQMSRLLLRLIFFILISGFTTALVIGAFIFYFQHYSFQNEMLQDAISSVDAAEAGIWSYDITNGTLVWNPRMYTLFDLSEEWHPTLDGFASLMHQEEPKEFKNMVHSVIEKGNLPPYTHQITLKDGRTRFVTSKGKTIHDHFGKPVKLVGLSWDSTERKKIEDLLVLSEEGAKIFNDATSLREATTKILKLFHEHLNWEVIEVWLLDENLELKLKEFFSIPEGLFALFEKASRELKVVKETPLLGQIWAYFRPSWYKNIQAHTEFKRYQASLETGLKGAMAFPIFQNNQIIGVIALYKRAPFLEEMEEKELNLFTSLGIQFGSFLEHLKIKDANKDLEGLSNFSSEAIFRFGLDGMIQSWNIGAEHIFGWKSHEIIGEHISKLYPEDKLHELDETRKKIVQGKTVERFRTQRKTKEGKLIWVEIWFAPVKNEHGRIEGIAEVLHEITDQMAALSQLKRSEEKHRAFVESTQDWIWEVDNNFKFTYSNPSVTRILGYDRQEILQKSMLDFLTSEYKDLIEILKINIKEKKGWTNRTLLYKHKDGSTRWLEGSSVPIIDERGQVKGFRGVDRDITERKNIEKLKNGFISVVSHELRTPLTSIHGSLGLLLKNEELSEKEKNLLEIAYRNSQRLTSLVGDILDIQKIEAGSLDLHLKPVSLRKVIREGIISISSFADKNQINIIEESALSEAKVYADYDRLIQVILNLLSNAVKFSPPGGTVYVSTQVMKEMARVLVRDHGEGIPEDFQPKVFTKFAQANVSNTRLGGGTGLGLSICKNIIDKMGGHIDFMTKKGEGTTFFFDLPIVKE